jgi:NADH-quinone oxidoreductase subunit G
MGVALGTARPGDVQAEIQRLGAWAGQRPELPRTAAGAAPKPRSGEAVLSTWPLLLDDGRLQEAEPYLAGTRKESVAVLAEATAKELGIAPGSPVRVSTDRGSITLPAAVADVPEQMVWLPTKSPGSHVFTTLGVTSGAVVRLGPGESA